MSRLVDETTVEKALRLLDEVEKSMTPEERGEHESIAKAHTTIDKALAKYVESEESVAKRTAALSDSPLMLLKSSQVAEFARTLGIEAGTDGAYEQLRKVATRAKVEAWLLTPEPAKCLGGAAYHLPVETLEAMTKR
jgi:hypothetical protein